MRTELLLAQGHQQFVFLQSQPGTLAQKQGYSSIFLAAGRALNVELTAAVDDSDCADQVIVHYLKKPCAAERIPALVCENNVMAFGVIQASRHFSQVTHLDVATVRMFAVPAGILPAGHPISGIALAASAGRNICVYEQLQQRHAHFGKVAPDELASFSCRLAE